MSLFNYVKSQLSILDVIGKSVRLKQIGNYWKGCCPFHSEKDASFTVSPDRQIFYCFGCHASGDAIAFVAKTENLSQLEAAQFLIEEHGITLPESIDKEYKKQAAQQEEKNRYFSLCSLIAQWAHKQLRENKAPYSYATQIRRISDHTLDTFTIGYIPSTQVVLKKLLPEINQHGFILKDLIEYGFVVQKKADYYSPFQERIIFPIKDIMGRVCGFGGRVFLADDKRAKYYNSKECEGFAKGKILFGLDSAKKTMLSKKAAFLVEGYMDCVAMAQYGWQNTVATLGTACSQEQLKLLARQASTVYVIYDNDKAGKQAMLRLTQLCWNVNLELKIITIPQAKDPADFLMGGGDLTKLIDVAQDIFNFFITSVGSNFHNKTLDEKLALNEQIIDIVMHIEDPLKQDILIQQAADIMRIPFESLKNTFKRKITNKKPQIALVKNPASGHLDNTEQDIPLLEEKIFCAILNSMLTDQRLTIEQQLVPYFSARTQRLLEAVNTVQERVVRNKGFFSSFLEELVEEDRRWIIRASMKHDSPITKEVFEQLLLHFCKFHWKQIVQHVKEELVKAKKLNNVDQMHTLMKKFNELKLGMQHRGLI
ncbi:MAG: DNA primase [Epsilonproteobacteria bacterium]|nr:DNA primase [Campylobacterota bacterium]